MFVSIAKFKEIVRYFEKIKGILREESRKTAKVYMKGNITLKISDTNLQKFMILCFNKIVSCHLLSSS